MKILTVNKILPLIILLAATFPSGAQVDQVTADQIHFSIISNTAMTFDWTGEDSILSYGTSADELSSQVTAVNPGHLPVSSPWVSDPGPYREAKLTGLQENTTYYYKIGSTGQVHAFKTPPPRGKADFRVCSTSDMHEGSKACLAMFEQIAGFHPDFVITTGDLTGAGPSGQQEVTERFRDAMVWSRSAAWMPAIGNHDWEYGTKDDLRTYKGRFDIPNPQTCASSPAVSCCGEDWGWFDYGNARFISWPERWNSSTTWQNWAKAVDPVMKGAQDDPDIRFIVTFGHQSAYTSSRGRLPGSGTQQALWNALAAKYPKFRLDLSGHNHQYERYSLPSGITYIINSTAGSYYRGWEEPTKPETCNFRAIHYGILVLDFSEEAIRGRFICSVGTSQTGPDYLPKEEDVCETPGSVIDEFTIYADSITAVGETVDRVPEDFHIRNYPNPFHLSTSISYGLGRTGHVKIAVYNLLGQRLAILEDGVREAGEHSVEWIPSDENGNVLPEGIYLAQVCIGKKSMLKRLVLIK